MRREIFVVILIILMVTLISSVGWFGSTENQLFLNSSGEKYEWRRSYKTEYCYQRKVIETKTTGIIINDTVVPTSYNTTTIEEDCLDEQLLNFKRV